MATAIQLSSHNVTIPKTTSFIHKSYINLARELWKNPYLFNTIKQLPKKARTAKKSNFNPNSFITYFRRGKIQKFFIAEKNEDSRELDFMDTAKLLESTPDTKKEKIPGEMFESSFLDLTEFSVKTTSF